MLVITANTTLESIQESRETVISIGQGVTSEQIQMLTPNFARVAVLNNVSPIAAIAALPAHIKEVDLTLSKYNLDARPLSLEQARAIPSHVSSAIGADNFDLIVILLEKGMKISAKTAEPKPTVEDLQKKFDALTLENQKQQTLIQTQQEEIKRLKSMSLENEEKKQGSVQTPRLFRTVKIHHMPTKQAAKEADKTPSSPKFGATSSN